MKLINLILLFLMKYLSGVGVIFWLTGCAFTLFTPSAIAKTSDNVSQRESSEAYDVIKNDVSDKKIREKVINDALRIRNAKKGSRRKKAESELLDSVKLTSDFVNIETIRFPKQSEKKLVVLESKADCFKLSSDDCKKRETEKKEHQKNVFRRAVDYAHSGLYDEPPDDPRKYPNFSSIVGFDTFDDDTISNEENQLVSFTPSSLLTKLSKYAAPKSIISLSFNLATETLDYIAEYKSLTTASFGDLIGAGSLTRNLKNTSVADLTSNTDYADINNSTWQPIKATKEDADKIKNLKSHKQYILVNSLENSEKDIVSTLNDKVVDAYRRLENFFFVSVVECNMEENSNKCSRKSHVLKGTKEPIDFFSLVSTGDFISNKNVAAKTSFETPVLAVVINNLLALSPDLTVEQVRKILKETASNYENSNNPVAELGYIVNPGKAYEFAVGSLLANSQKEYYSRCKKGAVTYTINRKFDPIEIEWQVDCHSTESPNGNSFDYQSPNYLSSFFNKRTIVMTKSKEGKSRYSGGKDTHSKPKRIALSDIVIHYRENEINVDFTKKIDEQQVDYRSSYIVFDKTDKTNKVRPHLWSETTITAK